MCSWPCACPTGCIEEECRYYIGLAGRVALLRCSAVAIHLSFSCSWNVLSIAFWGVLRNSRKCWSVQWFSQSLSLLCAVFLVHFGHQSFWQVLKTFLCDFQYMCSYCPVSCDTWAAISYLCTHLVYCFLLWFKTQLRVQNLQLIPTPLDCIPFWVEVHVQFPLIFLSVK